MYIRILSCFILKCLKQVDIFWIFIEMSWQMAMTFQKHANAPLPPPPHQELFFINKYDFHHMYFSSMMCTIIKEFLYER